MDMSSGYARVLALTRSRIFTAVVMPALIGAGYAYARGQFRLPAFVLILVGLVCAELLNLLGYDWNHYRNQDPVWREKNPLLPGNPVVPERFLPGRYIPVAVVLVGLVGLAVLVYFTVTVGPAILLLLGAAVGVGALYLFPFFPYAYLSTALLPPILVGGVYLALSGQWDWKALLSGLPVTWISVAVILTYRVLYAGKGVTARKSGVVAGFYGLAAAHVMIWSFVRIYPAAAIGAAMAIVGGILWLNDVWKRETRDAVPATTIGVLIHSVACLLLAGTIAFVR